MKFIFPQNYDFSHKLLGIFDTSTLLVNGIWALFVFCFLNLFFSSLNIKIFFFIILVFPFLLFSIIGFNHENILYVVFYIAKYIKRPKIYIYK
jgi:hypothetical protein